MVGEQVRGRSWASFSNASDGDTHTHTRVWAAAGGSSGARGRAAQALELELAFHARGDDHGFQYQLVSKSSIAQLLSSSFVVLIEYVVITSSCGGWGDPHNKTATSLH